ncbi:ankyrin repeat protein [Colletotrichum sojae]|uniref:Ankyrin repeat protein n=1 Tax=Colletotrichum sojae TaxID=2175907 RepID=A0A8H6N318_9PEZI|nr:ankyrin repeat protein [Colletotrichum sojae]
MRKDESEPERGMPYSRETTGSGSHGSSFSGDSKLMDTIDDLPLSGATRRCMAAFARLTSSSQIAAEKFRTQLPPHVAKNQHDRFKLWAGNLGALNSGRASIDFRLMDSALMQNTVLKFLEDLESNEVLQGARLPLEEALTRDFSSELEYSSDDSSSDESDPGSSNTRTELGQNTAEVDHILSSLVRVSFRIRSHATRTATLSHKALAYKHMVPTEGTNMVDLFEAYSSFDELHVQEFFLQIRRLVAEEGRASPSLQTQTPTPGHKDINNSLIERLSRSITTRRRIFAYWRRHARKLAKPETPSRPTEADDRRAPPAISVANLANLLESSDLGVKSRGSQVPSSARLTLLSGTEATVYHQRPDDTDAVSTVSYSSTAFDAEGNYNKIPPPPSLAPGQHEFVCPYCHVLCPAKDARRKHWIASWIEHEAQAHRRVWRCFEHKDLFRSEQELIGHLEVEHPTLTQVQLRSMSGLAHATGKDERSVCPFCLSCGPHEKDLADHMALHMERLASFSMPRSVGTEADDEKSSPGGSSRAAHGNRSMDSLRSVSLQFSDLVTATSPSSLHGDAVTPSDGVGASAQRPGQEAVDRRDSRIEWFTSYKDQDKHQEYLRDLHPGSLQWFLGSLKYRNWLSSPGQVLFTPGSAGTGKSIMASAVFEHLKQKFQSDESIKVVGLFGEAHRLETTPHFLFSSLLKQLLPESSIDAEISSSLSEQFSKGLVSFSAIMHDAIVGAANKLSRIFIVVDGIDALHHYDDQYFDIVFGWLMKRPGTNMLVTSRKIPTILRDLKNHPTLEIRAADHDIVAYTRAFVGEQMPGAFSEEPEMRALEAQVVEFANGVFLYAKLYLDFLVSGETSGEEATSCALRTNHKIEKAYVNALERISGSRSPQALYAALAWVVRSECTLTREGLEEIIPLIDIDCTPETFQHIGDASVPVVDLLLSSYLGLVEVNPNNSKLEFYHPTAYTYFSRTVQEWCPAAAKEQTLLCCSYLMSGSFSTGPCSTESEWMERLDLHPFFLHAARWWGRHARQALDNDKELAADDSPFIRAIRGFLASGPNLQAAVQAMNVTAGSWRVARYNYLRRSDWGPVHVSSYFGLSELITSFLAVESGEFLTLMAQTGQDNPVVVAATYGQVGALEDLLSFLGEGALRKDFRETGQWALSRAAQLGDEAIVRVLLNEGVSPNDGGTKPRKPLPQAVAGEHEAVVRLLLEHGADPDPEEGLSDKKPLRMAIESGNIAIARMLIEKGADVNSRDWTSKFPLFYAIKLGRADIVDLLLRNGADPDEAVFFEGWPLDIARELGDERIVERLEESDPNLPSQFFGTSLDVALQLGHEDVVRVLQEFYEKKGSKG